MDPPPPVRYVNPTRGANWVYQKHRLTLPVWG